MAETEIEWPWQYNFPPFFTLQVHSETRAKQLAAWKSLVIDYCKTHKICTIDTRDVMDLALFSNANINRTIQSELLNSVLNELKQSGNALPLDKLKQRWEIYWHTLEEFSTIIYNYITRTNNLQTVLTFYELTEGEDVAEEDFSRLTPEVLIKILKVLEDQGKCEMILFDDNQGVKFF